MMPARIIIDAQENLALANQEARSLLNLDLRDLGRPFRDLEISYRPLELRSLIEQARDEHQPVAVNNVRWALPPIDGKEYMDVSVTPLWGQEGRWLGTVISFSDGTERQKLKTRLEKVQNDLETAHEELQSTNEELETSNEELQSTVEELQTTNEELQSSNEETETMNEDLQAANNELQNMNEELRSRTRESRRAHAFLELILSSVDVGVVVVDRKFIITLWNERADDLWGLRASEVIGRSLLDLDIGLPVMELKKPIEQFLADKSQTQKVELNATNRRGKPIKCYITRTIRQDEYGEPEGVVLLMEEARP